MGERSSNFRSSQKNGSRIGLGTEFMPDRGKHHFSICRNLGSVRNPIEKLRCLETFFDVLNGKSQHLWFDRSCRNLLLQGPAGCLKDHRQREGLHGCTQQAANHILTQSAKIYP